MGNQERQEREKGPLRSNRRERMETGKSGGQKRPQVGESGDTSFCTAEPPAKHSGGPWPEPPCNIDAPYQI